MGRWTSSSPACRNWWREGLAAGRLAFTVGAAVAVEQHAEGVEVVFLYVPTPMGVGGVADLRAVEASAPPRELRSCWVDPMSRSPVIQSFCEKAPRFATSNPDRIVVGGEAQDAAERVAALYQARAPTVLTDSASAELVKYAANGFLAMKLSYVNAVAELCERLGADILDVTEGMSYDRRIGREFPQSWPRMGGSCLPKDTQALLQVADAADFEFRLMRASIDTNTRQRQRMVDKIRLAVTGNRNGSLTRTRVALLGLTFKAGTNDLRDSPALMIAAYCGRRAQSWSVAQADAAVVLTEWPEFRTLDWPRIAAAMGTPRVIDTRNLLDRDVLTRAGLTWTGVGRRQPSTSLFWRRSRTVEGARREHAAAAVFAVMTGLARSRTGLGRTGTIHTPHGDIATPSFVAVGTEATVKAVLPESMKELAGTRHRRRGRRAGQVHELDGPTFTDSGGFQVMSLGVGFKKVLAMEAVVQSDDVIAKGKERLATVDDEGVTFKSHLDGSKHRFTPEERSVERTQAWAIRCINEHEKLTAERADKPYQALFGVIQGAQYEDLRRQACRGLESIEGENGYGFDGYGIGGALEKQNLGTIVRWCNEELPENKPRHMLGISEPDDFFVNRERRGHFRLRQSVACCSQCRDLRPLRPVQHQYQPIPS
ncbi:unnamed protein product, partial [Mesorhabditis spiculigera]